MWCIQEIDAGYRERMCDVLDLYEEPYDPKKPVIGCDEKPKQLLGEKRKPIPMKPRSPGRCDCEYVRNGAANIFMAIDFKTGKRATLVTDRRTEQDFALFVKKLVGEDYPDADIIRMIVDNLNIHFESSFYETFGQREAKRILSKIELHYTPTHASWLNAAEIEINAMDAECTGRRTGDKETLARQVTAWTKRRDQQRKKIDWRFTKQDADRKLSKHYV
jgi:hypothetical protein